MHILVEDDEDDYTLVRDLLSDSALQEVDCVGSRIMTRLWILY